MKSQKFTLRPIAPEDVADIIHIAHSCGLSPWSAQDYAKETRRSDSTLLKLSSVNDETVGFIVGRRVLSTSAEEGFDAEIYNIGVDQGFQRSGCATLILREFLDRCIEQKVQTVWLDVRVSNHSAICFYKKFGFSEHALRPGFYGDPVEDGMIMSLNLQ